jgi:hypothetical protein
MPDQETILDYARPGAAAGAGPSITGIAVVSFCAFSGMLLALGGVSLIREGLSSPPASSFDFIVLGIIVFGAGALVAGASIVWIRNEIKDGHPGDD